MQYVTSGGKFVLSGGKFVTYSSPTIVPQLTLKLSVIRNAEMNNIVGDAGSTNLTITAINPTTGVLTIPNIPVYSGFTKEISTWAIKDVSNNTTSILCTVDSAGKTVTLNPSTGTTTFTVGHNISLFNPYLNYSFSGDQSVFPSITIDASTPAWRNYSSGGGTIFKDGSIYKWLFFGQQISGNNQVGLAVSSDMMHWDVSNGDQPIVTTAMSGSTSCFTSGNIMMVDSSYCCVLNYNAGGENYFKLMYFNKDVSALSFSASLKTHGYYGSIEKIGTDYYMLYMDVSTGVTHRSIKAAKSTSGIEGPYTDYQTIISAVTAVAGTIWDVACEMPTIINDGVKIFGMFGAQGTGPGGSYPGPGIDGGVGLTNTEYVMLDFDANTHLWSIDPLGPVIINPIDWPSDPWNADHCGSNLSTLIDGSTMYMGLTMHGTEYNATMTKLKNFA